MICLFLPYLLQQSVVNTVKLFNTFPYSLIRPSDNRNTQYTWYTVRAYGNETRARPTVTRALGESVNGEVTTPVAVMTEPCGSRKSRMRLQEGSVDECVEGCLEKCVDRDVRRGGASEDVSEDVWCMPLEH